MVTVRRMMLGTRVAGMCEIHPFAINSIILGYKVHQLPIKCIVLVYYVLNLVYYVLNLV